MYSTQVAANIYILDLMQPLLGNNPNNNHDLETIHFCMIDGHYDQAVLAVLCLFTVLSIFCYL